MARTEAENSLRTSQQYTPQYLQLGERAEHYAGERFWEYYAVFGVHRDSDTIARSNFAVILRELGIANPADAPNYDADEPAPVIVTRASHWAVGWIDTIRVHQDAGEVVRTADALRVKLEDYPILDEDHYSVLEWEETAEYWANCSVRERVDYLQRAGQCIFAARRAELPQDDNGRLFELLTR